MISFVSLQFYHFLNKILLDFVLSSFPPFFELLSFFSSFLGPREKKEKKKKKENRRGIGLSVRMGLQGIERQTREINPSYLRCWKSDFLIGDKT
jgi:hypothetical protein